jgi:hypothetical protein
MISGGQLIELFNTTTFRQDSELFYITRGWFAVLYAFGFDPIPVEIDPDFPRTAQRACLNYVLTRAETVYEDLPCGVFLEVGANTRVDIIAETPVLTGGCAWHMSACDNMKILDLPGLYRFVLNDPAAAGSVQIYLRYYPLTDRSRVPALDFGG